MEKHFFNQKNTNIRLAEKEDSGLAIIGNAFIIILVLLVALRCFQITKKASTFQRGSI